MQRCGYPSQTPPICLGCRVINGIQSGELRHLFNPENVFLSAHGGGAGNNWASGYHQAEEAAEDIIDMIGRHSGRNGSALLTKASKYRELNDAWTARNSMYVCLEACMVQHMREQVQSGTGSELQIGRLDMRTRWRGSA